MCLFVPKDLLWPYILRRPQDIKRASRVELNAELCASFLKDGCLFVYCHGSG